MKKPDPGPVPIVSVENYLAAMCRRLKSINKDIRSIGHVLMLMRLGRAEGQRMGDLAELCSICRAAVTGTVDRLEAVNLLERYHPPKGDRRVVLVKLTDAGRLLLERVAADVAENHDIDRA